MRRRWIAQAVAGVAIGVLSVVVVAACDDGPSRTDATTPPGESEPVPDGGVTRTITVGAVGEVELRPDTAQVLLGVQVLRPTAAEALDAANTKATVLIDALTASGVAEEDLQTSSVWMYPQYSDDGREITGYSAGNQLSVVLRDLETAGETIDAVAGFVGEEVTIGGISFYVDDPTAGQTEARAAAMVDAERRAQEYADAAGVELGEILSISEVAASTPSPLYLEGAADAAGAESSRVPLQTGTQTYTLNVTVVYAMA
jgi:hypothetical protein